MEDIFAIGDIHGELIKLDNLLKHWNPDREQLVLLGDLIDRGEQSYDVLLLAQKLQKEYGAKIISGNHEEMFLNWLDDPFGELSMYYPQGGIETIHSFFERRITSEYSPDYIATLLKTQFPDEIQMIKGLLNYYEHGDFVFVHAGVDLDIPDWKETDELDFKWIREEFHYGKNESGKIFVFGHTPTPRLNLDKSTRIWISPCKTKIGIDGGAVFGGSLHGLRIQQGQLHEVVSVDHFNQISQSSILL